MKVKIHQDVLGHKAGTDDVEVDGTQAEWLIANGYASAGDDDSDKLLTTSTEAKNDPTLAANREAPNEYDAAQAEADATNSDAQKLQEAKDAAPVRTTGATEKRDAATADEATGTADDKQAYTGGDEPTAGRQAVPVDDSAPVPAVADKRETADDTKASEA